MASDEPTSDESDESSTDESTAEESGSESQTSGDSLSFGSKAAEAADDSTASDEDAESDDFENDSAASEDSGDSEDSDATEDSGDADPEDSDADASEDTEDEEEAYDPNKIPPLSERATLFGAWGCVGLVIVVTLVFFVLIKSAIDKIDDYGAVASDDESDEPSVERPSEEPEERVRPPVTRRLEWPTSYPEARAAARIDERPIVIVFTAEYATESLDVFDGVFSNDDIENYLERFFQIVHIDMGLQGTDPSIALCEVEFLPHVCYLHPETEAKLNEDTTGMIGTSALLRELTTARVAYEASAEAD
ncbi:MAG: hypothetical protein AB8H86_23800 [Polyangiales bacterium]